MSATKLWDMGYTDIIPVIPPGATLSPTSSLEAHHLGKIPGQRKGNGTWVGYPWLREEHTRDEAVQWEKWGANIGLRGTHFPGLDIDVEHPKLVEVINAHAMKILHEAPVRTREGSPRILRIYRTEEPFERMALKITLEGQDHLVEWLCDGRQYLVEGTHPSGAKYGWQEEPLEATPIKALQTVTREDAKAFLEYLAHILSGVPDCETELIGSARLMDPADAPDQETLLAPDLAVLAEVVEQIPNDFPDRESYISMGCAIKAAGGDEALDIFQDWCARWEGGTNDPATVEADWNRMYPPFRIGWEYLQDLAQEEGGYAVAASYFEVSESAGPMHPNGTSPNAGILSFTDTWVAEKLADRLHSRIRYVPETGHWHVWDGHAWAQDRRNRAPHMIRKSLTRLSQYIQERAAAFPVDDDTSDERKRLMKFAAALQSRSALLRVLPELQAHPTITLTLEEFDADPWILNTPGGIVDLRTGEMSDSDPGALLSKSTAVAPRMPGDFSKTRWATFLQEATGGDRDLALFLQKQCGYALTGVTQEQSLCFIHGPPLTGKSVFIDTIAYVFGTYHETAAPETFAAGRGNSHPTDLAKLAGSRLVTSVETAEGRAWDTQRIKSATGGDRLTARFMRQDFFEFEPTFKIMMVGNYEPEIRGVDDAMMRRLHIIPFTHSPPEVDRLLVDKLKEEAPAILAWAIQGCSLWLDQGLAPPKAVQDRTARYRYEEDPVALFIEDSCELGEDFEVARTDLFYAWQLWCRQQGEDPGSLKQMKRRFDSKAGVYGFTDARFRMDDGAQRRGYRGIAVKEEDINHL